jgi:NAD(P)-dependent dehydrogenase (short-subunit alcohol dehydrogenase family)
MNNGIKKTIWVMGAGSGIGRALAITLSRQGHQLILSGRRVDRLESLKSEFIHGALIVPADITKEDSLLDAYTQIKSAFGNIDSVICMSADYQPMTIDNLDLKRCQHILDTNLMSAFSILHTVVPDMKSHGQGQIVFCASVAGYRGLPNGQPYSAAKAGLINLAETARFELYPYGIDVKIINPGFVKTDMTDKNAFRMPMIITAELAAERIVSQLVNPNQFEIRTHKVFTVLMKFIKLIPDCIYFRLLRR